jgi:hypothetical protein
MKRIRPGKPSNSSKFKSRVLPLTQATGAFFGAGDTGGHFAAVQTPQLLIDDIRTFFATLT